MPIYEYKCPECEVVFSQLQKMSDPPPEACPTCGSVRVFKIISAGGFELKGTGWYKTDFKDK